jgi:predicted transglutaminase-like cysteine proteinase
MVWRAFGPIGPGALAGIVCLLLGGCASLQASGSDASAPRVMARAERVGVLQLDGFALAPRGLVDYCQRDSVACGQTAEAAPAQSDANPTGAQGAFQGSSTTDAFRMALMAMAREDNEGGLDDAGAPAARVQIPLTEARWAELKAVNEDVNSHTRAVTDMAQFGVAELWRPVGAGPDAAGDCEDVALEKRARLIALGWRADVLSLATAIAPGVGMHATLVVATDQGDFILDSLYPTPVTVDHVAYKWIAMQRPGDLLSWAQPFVARISFLSAENPLPATIAINDLRAEQTSLLDAPKRILWNRKVWRGRAQHVKARRVMPAPAMSANGHGGRPALAGA